MDAAFAMPSLTQTLRLNVQAVLLAAGLAIVPAAAQAEMGTTEAAALMSAGADAIERGQLDKAATDFSNALDSGGLNVDGRALAYYHRAIAFQKTGQQDAAIADYSRAITANSLPAAVQARAHYNRGIALANAGDLERAESDYRTAIALAPDYAAVYHNLANLERRRQSYDAAIENYSTAIRLMPGNERKLPLFGRALAYEQTGNLSGAEADLRIALAIDPEFEVAGAKLAELSPNPSVRENATAALVNHGNKAPEPRVLPAMLTPFQSISSGNEGAAVIRIATTGGWETTAVRFEPSEEVSGIAAGASGPPVNIVPADRLTTASLRPTAAIPHEAASMVPPASDLGAASPRYRIQLGAFRDEQTAREEWKRIAGSVGGVVGQYDHLVQRADLGERGVFYRLRAGAFDGIADARSACKALQARKFACVIVDG